MSEYYEVYVKGNHVEDCTRSWREIGAPHKPNVLLIRKSSTTAASVTAKASIDTTLQVQDEKKGANEHTHAHGTMSAPSQPDVTNQSVNKGIAVPHKKSGGRNSQPNEAKATGIQSAPSRDTPIALSPSKKIESHAQNRYPQQLSPLSIQHSVVQSVRFAQQLEEIVAPQVTAVRKPRQLLVVMGILQREDFTGLHGVAAIQHRSLRQSNDSKVMLDSNSVEELSLKADVSTTRALGPFNIDRKLNSAAKCDLDGLTTATGQHTIKESAELRKDPQRVGVLLQGEEQTGAWKAHRKAAKKEKHREIQRAKRQCKSQIRLLEKEKARATSQWPHVSERLHKKARTTSQWLIVLKNHEVTKEEWPRIRNHLRSTSPQLFRRIKKGDAVIDCDSLRYEAQNFKPASLPFILVAVRHGMPTQVLIETVRAVRAAIQARVSEMAAARETALAHPVKCDKDQGDIGHASRDGSGKPSSRPGNDKSDAFALASAWRPRHKPTPKLDRQPGFKSSARVPNDPCSLGAHPSNTENVDPAPPTGKFPRLQRVWPHEQRFAPFTNRSDFYHYKGRTEAQIWQADYPEEANRLLSVMRPTSGKRPARSELQSMYEIQWRIKNIWQPMSVFRHLVRTIWAEHDSQGQNPRHSNGDAQRWDRWIRFLLRLMR